MSTQSVVTAMRVLEAVSDNQPAGLSELSREVDVPKATVLRMLRTLGELGWVAQSGPQAGKWVLTNHAFAVASRGSSGSLIRDAAMGPMNALQLDTTETVHLAVPDRRFMVVIERLDTPHVLRAFLPLGARLPLHASANGIAYLAAADESYVSEYLAGPLEAETPQTVVDPKALRKVIAETQARGYSINEQGLSTGITSIGVAILGPGQVPAGSISISGPSSRIVPAKFEEYGEAAVGTAREISRALGAYSAKGY
ncbi:IclR family transcriptional regulator [Arthrobacter cavernae]|uniref:IclR family transcriptional regulator n=1 Tax=Arthrobacter cavernae TaxID=2817681 RepID=A0A939KJD9_9MICC|nr:IclR family transcriptional regulator [Arthrobacter cavernae]MBO1268572.1 IclR family transcriptional regulator [Arthrobacter cavernae]